jgi:hypothetical protein
VASPRIRATDRATAAADHTTDVGSITMGFLGSLAKAGAAKKLFDEARKPQNQQKAKELWAKFRDDGGKGGTTKR